MSAAIFTEFEDSDDKLDFGGFTLKNLRTAAENMQVLDTGTDVDMTDYEVDALVASDSEDDGIDVL